MYFIESLIRLMRSKHNFIDLKFFNCTIVLMQTNKFDLQIFDCNLRLLSSFLSIIAKLNSTFDKNS